MFKRFKSMLLAFFFPTVTRKETFFEAMVILLLQATDMSKAYRKAAFRLEKMGNENKIRAFCLSLPSGEVR